MGKKLLKLEKEADKICTKLWPETSTAEGKEDLKRRMSEVDRNLNGRELEIAYAKMALSLTQRINEHGGSFSKYLRMGIDLIKKDAHIYTGTGRKKHIALDLGSHDMAHIGHFIRAQVVRDNISIPVDEVWMTPAFKNLGSKVLEKPKHRTHMINLGLELKENRGIKMFDYEIRNKYEGSTFHFLKNLEQDKEHEDKIFYLVIGADIVDDVPNWRNGHHLIKEATFIIVGRPGYSLKRNAWYTQYPHWIIESDRLIEASSSKVKEFIEAKNEEAILEMLYPQNWEYIKQKGLYGAK